VADLLALDGALLGAAGAQALFEPTTRARGADRIDRSRPTRNWCSSSRRSWPAPSAARRRASWWRRWWRRNAGLDDVMRLDEASQLRPIRTSCARSLNAASCAPPTNSKSLDRLKDDFMSSVTHELRTPLTSIRALAELMRDDPTWTPAQRQQFLGMVVAETERLSRLVNQVLDMAKIESGHADWHNADVDLRALLAQAVQTTAELFRERGARRAGRCPKQVPHAARRPRPAAAGGAEPAVQRGQVRAEGPARSTVRCCAPTLAG
jgi:signal transduction histidine kinase